jgi:hypothetical protein
MPCRSEYTEPSNLERELSRVYLILDELNGLNSLEKEKEEDRRRSWEGYDRRAYNRGTQKDLDEKTAVVCERLKALSELEIKEFSLELQIWWRDHQAWDKKREASEVEKAKKKLLQREALEKLTDEEREALGLK